MYDTSCYLLNITLTELFHKKEILLKMCHLYLMINASCKHFVSILLVSCFIFNYLLAL